MPLRNKKPKITTETKETLSLNGQTSQDNLIQLCQLSHSVYKQSCKSCRALRREWYQYLSDQGFEDLEKNDELRVTYHSIENIQAFQHQQVYQAQYSYYEWAQSKINSKFRSQADKLIWQLHSEAYSQREISPHVGLEQSWVNRKIQKIRQYLTSSASMAIA